MKIGLQILIGLGISALIGGGIYLAVTKMGADSSKPEDKPSTGSKQPGAKPNPGFDLSKENLEKIQREARCSWKVPPPRVKSGKQIEYDKCMHEASGTWGS